jgi:hypothetical protein
MSTGALTNREWIDQASYEEMLRLWRFAPVGSTLFVGDVGVYFQSKMHAKEAELSPAERVAISKKVGW